MSAVAHDCYSIHLDQLVYWQRAGSLKSKRANFAVAPKTLCALPGDGEVIAMASREGPLCSSCGVKIPIEDAHDFCVYCLGEDHARAARVDPAACMSCFCMTARQREACCRLFLKAVTPAVGPQPAKRSRPVSSAVGRGRAQVPHTPPLLYAQQGACGP